MVENQLAGTLLPGGEAVPRFGRAGLAHGPGNLSRGFLRLRDAFLRPASRDAKVGLGSSPGNVGPFRPSRGQLAGA